jgi:hypothetical protein
MIVICGGALYSVTLRLGLHSAGSLDHGAAAEAEVVRLLAEQLHLSRALGTEVLHSIQHRDRACAAAAAATAAAMIFAGANIHEAIA